MRTKQAEYKTLTNLYHSPTIIQINAYVNINCSGKILSSWLLYLKYTGSVLASNDSLFRRKRYSNDGGATRVPHFLSGCFDVRNCSRAPLQRSSHEIHVPLTTSSFRRNEVV